MMRLVASFAGGWLVLSVFSQLWWLALFHLLLLLVASLRELRFFLLVGWFLCLYVALGLAWASLQYPGYPGLLVIALSYLVVAYALVREELTS